MYIFRDIIIFIEKSQMNLNFQLSSCIKNSFEAKKFLFKQYLQIYYARSCIKTDF